MGGFAYKASPIRYLADPLSEGPQEWDYLPNVRLKEANPIRIIKTSWVGWPVGFLVDKAWGYMYTELWFLEAATVLGGSSPLNGQSLGSRWACLAH